MRGFDTQFLQRVADADLRREVRALVAACVSRRVSVAQVAQMLDVSRMTVYHWMLGNVNPRPQYLTRIVEVTKRIKARQK